MCKELEDSKARCGQTEAELQAKITNLQSKEELLSEKEAEVKSLQSCLQQVVDQASEVGEEDTGDTEKVKSTQLAKIEAMLDTSKVSDDGGYITLYMHICLHVSPVLGYLGFWSQKPIIMFRCLLIPLCFQVQTELRETSAERDRLSLELSEKVTQLQHESGKHTISSYALYTMFHEFDTLSHTQPRRLG